MVLDVNVVSDFRDDRVSSDTINIIRKLLVLNPDSRFTASQVLVALTGIIDKWYCFDGFRELEFFNKEYFNIYMLLI